MAAELEDFALNVYDRESTEHYEWMHYNMDVFTHHESVFFPGFQEMNQKILIDGLSVAAGINEVKPVVQQHLDELFGN